MLVEFVKVYKDSSSGEWDFSEGSNEEIRQRTTIDDGTMILDDRQLKSQYETASSLIQGESGKGQMTRDLPGPLLWCVVRHMSCRHCDSEHMLEILNYTKMPESACEIRVAYISCF